jgi:hypothetical protein
MSPALAKLTLYALMTELRINGTLARADHWRLPVSAFHPNLPLG